MKPQRICNVDQRIHTIWTVAVHNAHLGQRNAQNERLASLFHLTESTLIAAIPHRAENHFDKDAPEPGAL
jgi:hypothetical protein